MVNKKKTSVTCDPNKNGGTAIEVFDLAKVGKISLKHSVKKGKEVVQDFSPYSATDSAVMPMNCSCKVPFPTGMMETIGSQMSIMTAGRTLARKNGWKLTKKNSQKLSKKNNRKLSRKNSHKLSKKNNRKLSRKNSHKLSKKNNRILRVDQGIDRVGPILILLLLPQIITAIQAESTVHIAT